jgi:outer membrane lipoprotein-sorting protein
MKKILVLTAVLFSMTAIAQKDPKAKAILDKVSANFKSLKSVEANYNLTVTNRAGKNAGNKSGKIYLKGQKYLITEKSLLIISDGKKIWRYEQEANEVSVSNANEVGDGITPQKLFTNFYDKDFIYKLNGNVKQGNKTLAEIEMTPIDKRKNFFKVYLYVEEAQKMIVSSKIFENSGNVYTYSMSGLKLNQPLKDELFVFNKAKYPGVEEINN